MGVLTLLLLMTCSRDPALAKLSHRCTEGVRGAPPGLGCSAPNMLPTPKPHLRLMSSSSESASLAPTWLPSYVSSYSSS